MIGEERWQGEEETKPENNTKQDVAQDPRIDARQDLAEFFHYLKKFSIPKRLFWFLES